MPWAFCASFRHPASQAARDASCQAARYHRRMTTFRRWHRSDSRSRRSPLSKSTTSPTSVAVGAVVACTTRRSSAAVLEARRRRVGSPQRGAPVCIEVAATRACARAGRRCSPKSPVTSSAKSRKMAGTRSTHCPPIFSHTAWATQSKPVSTVQVDEQPSPSIMLPSSQSSSMSRPSPQSEVQDAPAQFGSRKQIAEQPSKGRVAVVTALGALADAVAALGVACTRSALPSHFLPSSTRSARSSRHPGRGSVVTLLGGRDETVATARDLRQGCPGAAQLKPGSVAGRCRRSRRPNLVAVVARLVRGQRSISRSPRGITSSAGSLQSGPSRSPSRAGRHPTSPPPLPPPGRGASFEIVHIMTLLPLASPLAPQPAEQRQALRVRREPCHAEREIEKFRRKGSHARRTKSFVPAYQRRPPRKTRTRALDVSRRFSLAP